MRGQDAGRKRIGVVVQDSERALVPLTSELSGTPRAPDGRVDVPRLLVAAAFGLAMEAQRRSLDAAGAVVGGFGGPSLLALPRWRWRERSVAVRGTTSTLTAGLAGNWRNSDERRGCRQGRP